MCIDSFFLIKEHKALKNNCSSLQCFTFHTRQKAQPPPASAKLKGEPGSCTTELGLLSVSGHHVDQLHCWDSKHPGPDTSPASDQVISLSGLMFPHLYWRRKCLQSYLLLSGDAQRVKELMFIKCSAPERETMG